MRKTPLLPVNTLEKLPTRRLLSYYRSRRSVVDTSCEFGHECCGYIMLREEEVESWLEHLEIVKSMLDKRENVV